MAVIDSKSRVLVVDDSAIARRLLVKQLNELGVTSVTEADDGSQALEILIREKKSKISFDLIITDLRMPTMSGGSLLKALSENEDFKSIPKLIASVESDRGMLLEAVLNGADGYIMKPTTTPELKVKVERVFARKRAA